MLDNDYKSLFGVLRNDIHYFDYAATTFMPKSVIEKWVEYQNTIGVFHGKGKNILSNAAQDIMVESEKTIKKFLGAFEEYDFIYSKNTTEVINLVALSLENEIKPMDYIMVGPYEHHSNYLPWKYLAQKQDAIFMEMPVDSDGNVDYEYIKQNNRRIKVMSVSSVANTNGYAINLDKLLSLVGEDTLFFVDESQKLAHSRLTVNKKIAGHFLSSHKMYGPKNIAGALMKKEIIKKIPPILLGGGMVNTVGFNDTWADGKAKFEAGTMDIGAIYAWSEACRFIETIGFETINKIDKYCHAEIYDVLNSNENIDIIQSGGSGVSALISFTDKRLHAHDMEYIFSKKKILIRSGNLCSQNSIRKFNNYAINRISFGVGVSEDDLSQLVDVLKELQK